MAVLRRVLFWCHLACGVIAGAVILVMCITGVALTYQKEMQYWADTRHYRAPPPAAATSAPVADLVAAARTLDAQSAVTTITWRADPEAPVALALGARTVYANPYTGAIYGEGTGQRLRAFFTSMTSWHRYLAMSGDQRPLGKSITGASNLLFLFIVLSGLCLWWPRTLTWTQVRQVTWFRRGLRAKARDFNWHNVIGFWSAIPLAVVVYSATVISYSWSNDLVYRVMGEAPPVSAAGRASAPAVQRSDRRDGSTALPAGIDPLVGRAMAFQPEWNMLALRVPTSDRDPLMFTIDRGDAGQPNLRGTLTLSSGAGEVLRWEDYSAQTPGRQARTWLRFAHTGEIYGLPGQTIAGLVTAGGAVLVYTGLALAVRRLRTWLRRRAESPTGVLDSDGPRASRA